MEARGDGGLKRQEVLLSVAYGEEENDDVLIPGLYCCVKWSFPQSVLRIRISSVINEESTNIGLARLCRNEEGCFPIMESVHITTLTDSSCEGFEIACAGSFMYFRHCNVCDLQAC